MIYEYYLIIFITCLLAFGLAGVILLISGGINYFYRDFEKSSIYECGFNPFSETIAHPFSVQFYLVGILFIIFDLEIIFLFPWCVSAGLIGSLGFWVMIIFLLLLVLGFWFEWTKGTLNW